MKASLTIYRFFINAATSAEILELPPRFLEAVWDMLSQLSSCTSKIHVPSYRKLARKVFQYFVEVSTMLWIMLVIMMLTMLVQDLGPYKSMTANLHMLVAHIPDWVQ